jgi:hypothetical protein
MLVTVVGSGKLATELLEHLELPEDMKLQAWSDLGPGADAAFVVHAGSGRELEPVIAYCECSGATLLELATGSVLENACPAFPVVLCPNTNILMLKFMSLLASSGPLLRGYHILLEESHQHGKTSAPGTALALAESLGLRQEAIVSRARSVSANGGVRRPRRASRPPRRAPHPHQRRGVHTEPGVTGHGCSALRLWRRAVAARPSHPHAGAARPSGGRAGQRRLALDTASSPGIRLPPSRPGHGR